MFPLTFMHIKNCFLGVGEMEYVVERRERKLSHVARALRSRTGDVTVVRNRHI